MWFALQSHHKDVTWTCQKQDKLHFGHSESQKEKRLLGSGLSGAEISAASVLHIRHNRSCVFFLSEYFSSALLGPKRRRALTKLRRRSIAELLPLGSTLQTLAALQIDANPKVCKAASSCLCRAATCRSFRSKVTKRTQSEFNIQVCTKTSFYCGDYAEISGPDTVLGKSSLWNLSCQDSRFIVMFGCCASASNMNIYPSRRFVFLVWTISAEKRQYPKEEKTVRTWFRDDHFCHDWGHLHAKQCSYFR